jgi:hypothetical protein
MKWLDKKIEAAVERIVFRHVTTAMTEQMERLKIRLASDVSFCKQVADNINEEDVAEQMDVSAIASKIDCEALAIRVSQNFRFQRETCQQLDYSQLGKALLASIKANG